MGRKLSAYNLHMKRELKGKMKGKTKAQRKAIFKAAARAWKSKKRNPKPRSKPKVGGSSRSRPTARRLNTTMGKKGGFNMNKIYSLIRKGAIVLPAAGIAMEPISTAEKLEQGVRAYFGYSMKHKQFNWGWLAQGWTPYLASIGVTYGLPKLASIIRGI